MKRSLTLICLLFAALSAKAQTITINASGSVNWDFIALPNFLTITPQSLPAGVTSFPTSAMVIASGFMSIDAQGAINFPVPAQGETQLFSTTFMRGGSLVSSATSFFNSGAAYNFLTGLVWLNGAVAGTDNYIGIGVKDDADNTYYGYLQFELHEFDVGQLAVQILGGALNSVANQSILIPAVPEPSTWALGLAGVALVAVAARRRMRKAA